MNSNSSNILSNLNSISSVNLGSVPSVTESKAENTASNTPNSSDTDNTRSKKTVAIPRDSRLENFQEDNTMAEMTTTDLLNLYRDHSDIRREGAEHTNEIVKEGLKASCELRGDIKDARYDVVSKVDHVGDRVVADIDRNSDDIKDRLTTVTRDTIDLRAQVTALGITVKDNAAITALQTEKAVLQNTIEGQKNTQYLADKIVNENEKTRDLIQDLKTTDLNRFLIERNAELVEERHYGRHWRHTADQNQFAGQWAAVQSQLQAFASQLQETRQGIYNFGSMAGNAGQQSSTSNNVR
jgi:hypothetical protein